ncbi:hypothetical protein D3C73_1142130 [compost metagenome]
MADLFGNLAVAAGLAERNSEQRLPHLFLKVGTAELQFQVEALAVAGKIFSQLLPGVHQDGQVGRFAHRPEPDPVGFVVFPEDGRQSRTVRDQCQFAHWRGHGGAGESHAGICAQELNKGQAYCLIGEAQYVIPTILASALEALSSAGCRA